MTACAFPCEACGELVRLDTNSPNVVAVLWGQNIVRVWCDECRPAYDEVAQQYKDTP